MKGRVGKDTYIISALLLPPIDIGVEKGREHQEG